VAGRGRAGRRRGAEEPRRDGVEGLEGRSAVSRGPRGPAAGVDGRRGPPRRALGSVPVSSPGLGDVKIVEKPSRLTGETEEPRNKRRRRSLGLDESASTASRFGAARTGAERLGLADFATEAPRRAVRKEGGAEEKASSNEALGWHRRRPGRPMESPLRAACRGSNGEAAPRQGASWESDGGRGGGAGLLLSSSVLMSRRALSPWLVA